MGVLGFAEADIEQLVSEDERFAEDLDRQRMGAVRAVAETASS